MADNSNYLEEIKYLNEILDLLKSMLEYERRQLENQKADLIQSRREMWENTSHTSADFEKLTDLNQYLSALQVQTLSYAELAKRISKHERMLDNPYFARVDFTEEGYDDTEKIYIGLFNLMDDETHEIKVYDWRAPIASLYYRNEVGPVEYQAPAGLIKGLVSLKRQFKINKGKLEYFIDSNINILDEMLMVALSKNMTSKMKTIVETIQKQQDLIIRDLHNDLLVVQGVAGSGKSSVALHRIAYLMYQGLNLKLSANDIIVISPNPLFSKYISNVLPELGEESINEYTFENIFVKLFGNNLSMKTKSENFDSIITAETEEKRNFLRSYDDFKGSFVFSKILDRFLEYYGRKLIPFEDVYYNGKVIEKRELAKAFLLSSKLNMPIGKKLKIIESRIMEKVKDDRIDRRNKIEKAVNKLNNHEFETMSFTRLLAAKETLALKERLKKYTEIDVFYLYKKLFSDISLFKNISRGLDLPENIDEIINYTKMALGDPYNFPYADGIALIYLKLKAEGSSLFSGIKQVVVDEAQDYYPIHYKILKDLYRYARFTIVGDINQTIEKNSDLSLYDDIISIFDFEKSNKVFLNKSYRSSYEIGRFSAILLGDENYAEFFKRNEEEPLIFKAEDKSHLYDDIIKTIDKYNSEGFSSIAIICKDRKEAADLYFKLSSKIKIKLIDYLDYESILEGNMILPVYLAKGLEFDAVIVYEANDEKYKSEFDKKLLYIACTRALHRLSLFYTGNLSRFLK